MTITKTNLQGVEYISMKNVYVSNVSQCIIEHIVNSYGDSISRHNESAIISIIGHMRNIDVASKDKFRELVEPRVIPVKIVTKERTLEFDALIKSFETDYLNDQTIKFKEAIIELIVTGKVTITPTY
jgi:hypothetical protein